MAKQLCTEEYKECIRNILFKIDRICRENDIEYFLCGGTMLGAVRHNGFIPWDDDIDIMMSFKDFDRLEELICSGDYGLNFLYIDRNRDTIFPCGKICDVNTEIVRESSFKKVGGYGAFVDVFPFTYYPDNEVLRKLYLKKQLWYRRLAEHCAREKNTRCGNVYRDFMKKAAFVITRRISPERVVRYIDRDLRRHDEKPTGWRGPLQVPYPAEILEEKIDMEFEGRLLYVVKDYDTALRIQYGNYMTLPPESERYCKHHMECILKNGK